MRPIKYAAFGIFVVLLIAVSLVKTQSPQRWRRAIPEIEFEQMTPAQHLARAKSIMQFTNPLKLTEAEIVEAARHLSVIPYSSREAVEAEEVIRQYNTQLQAVLGSHGYEIVGTIQKVRDSEELCAGGAPACEPAR